MLDPANSQLFVTSSTAEEMRGAYLSALPVLGLSVATRRMCLCYAVKLFKCILMDSCEYVYACVNLWI